MEEEIKTHEKHEYTEEMVIKRLERSKFFEGVTQTDIRAILPRLQYEIVTIDPLGIYYSEGEKITKVGILFSGDMAISKMQKDGGENLIQKIGEGFMAGVDIACSSTQINPYRIYSVQGADVFTFRINMIMEEGILSNTVRIILMKNIMTFLANDNIRRQYKIDVLTINSLRERIMVYLWSRAGKLGKTQFRIPFNRQEMANYLCVNRSALSHELSLMRQDGLIDFHKFTFKIN